MNFRLEERPPGWVEHAPIQIHHELLLPAPPERVFELLADSPGWTTWFKGMRRVRIDAGGRGVGTLRTVWIGATRVQEHFTAWEPDRQITFHLVKSNSPGMRVMVEDYRISPAAEGSTLSITVGIEAKGPFRLVPRFVRMVVGHVSGGVLGVSSAFSQSA